jgi:MoxR-like ATPase
MPGARTAPPRKPLLLPRRKELPALPAPKPAPRVPPALESFRAAAEALSGRTGPVFDGSRRPFIPAPEALWPFHKAPDLGWTRPEPRTLEDPGPEDLSPDTIETLAALGLDYPAFRGLCAGQANFESMLLALRPGLRPFVSSLRNQRRFSRAVLDFSRRLKEAGEGAPLAEGLLLALRDMYGDLLPLETDPRLTDALVESNFGGFLPQGRAPGDLGALADKAQAALKPARGPIDERIARALLTDDTALFLLPKGSRRAFLDALRERAERDSSLLRVLWCHPHEELQLIGHPVSRSEREGIEFAYGELVRAVLQAREEERLAASQRRPPRAVLLLMQNVEAMDHGARLSLQEAINARVLTDPELGRMEIPANLRFLFTMAEDGSIQDKSFYDRTLVKRLPSSESPEAPSFRLPEGVTEENYLGFVSIRREGGRSVLVLPGAEIPLGPGLEGLRGDDLLYELFDKAGVVLDFDSVRMLAAMQWARTNRMPILRVQGPTGVGKTYCGRSLAALLGIPFLSRPFDADTRFGDLVGKYRQDKDGVLRFHGDTEFARSLEAGGLVALSELNTLIGEDGRASFGWWLLQLAQTPTGPDGSRVLELADFPVPKGKPVPRIRMAPGSLVLVDTNPEREYDARGRLPEALDDLSPGLEVAPLVSGDPAREGIEKARLKLHAGLRLRKKGFSKEEALVLAGLAAEAFWKAESARVRGELGASEKRAYSLRELCRMADDAGALVRSGADPASALARAAYDHLVRGWRSPSDRRRLRRLLKLKVRDASIESFLKDQLLDKGRPVHLRVEPETDLRGELAALRAMDPDMEIVFVPVTEHTDRFQLEGGLVPEEGTRRLEFGEGLFGRMARKALGKPGGRVLYVFENAHNLRPEVIVAANEFLQTGELHPPDGEPVLKPGNARMLFISRADSPIAWSPAERSRLVETAYRQGASWLGANARAAFAEALPAEPRAASFLAAWAVSAYRAWERGMSGADATRDLSSHARFLRWVRKAAAAAPGAASVRAATEDVLLAALPRAGREAMEWALFSPLWRGLSAQDGDSPVAELAGLENRAAAPPRGEEEAVRAMVELAKGLPEKDWAPARPEQMFPGDVISASFAPRDADLGGPVDKAASTPDGRWVLAAGRGALRLLRIENGRADESWSEAVGDADAVALGEDASAAAAVCESSGKTFLSIWRRSGGSLRLAFQDELPQGAKSLRISADGRVVLAVGKDSKALAFVESGGAYRPQALPYDNGFGVEAAALSADGGTVLLSHQSLLRTFVLYQGAFEPSGRLVPAREPVLSLALSRDGRRALAAGRANIHDFTRADAIASAGFPYEENGCQAIGWADSVSLAPDCSSALVVCWRNARLLDLSGLDSIQKARTAWAWKAEGSVLSTGLTPGGVAFVERVGQASKLRSFSPGMGVVDERGMVRFEGGASMPRTEMSGATAKLVSRPRDIDRLAAPILDLRSAWDRLGAWLGARRADLLWSGKPKAGLRPMDLARSPLPSGLSQRVYFESGAYSTAVSDDGLFILAGTKDGWLRLLRRDFTGEYREVFGRKLSGSVSSVSLSADGRTLAAADDKLRSWVFAAEGDGYKEAFWDDGGRFSPKPGEMDHPLRATVSGDGKSVLLTHHRDALVLRGNDGAFAPAAKVPAFLTGGINGSWISPDGSLVLLGGTLAGGAEAGCGVAAAFRFDPAKGAYERFWSSEVPSIVFAVGAVPDGSRIFVNGGEWPASLIAFERTPAGYREVWEEPGLGVLGSIVVSPDGRDLWAVQTDGTVLAYRWDGGGYRRLDAGPKAPSFSRVSSALSAVAPLGGLRVRRDVDGALQVYTGRDFLILDARSAVSVDTGRVVEVADLPDVVEVLSGVKSSRKAEGSPAGKPFFFSVDASGKVALNLRGRSYPTRHALLSPKPPGPVELGDLRDPRSDAPVPLSEDDFLLPSEALDMAEASALEAFADNWGVYLVGGPGSGKTALASELALLLGLPGDGLLMHGERELSDLIGSFREDEYGRLTLSARPRRDPSGRLRFKPKLLDFLVNGGVFNADEGAVGERARELLSWLALVARGEKELVLQEFPGSEIRLKVHPDFHLVITSNDEDAQSRLRPKSEVAAYLHAVRLDEDEAPGALGRFFMRFLGKGEAAWGEAAAKAFLGAKALLGPRRSDLTRRELRRAARLFGKGPSSPYGLFQALLAAFAPFAPEGEGPLASAVLGAVSGDGKAGGWAAKSAKADAWEFPAPSRAESVAAGRARRFLDAGEPVLLLPERGARTSSVAAALAGALGASMETVDAAPEHDVREIVGGPFVNLGPREEGKPRSRLVLGRLTRHLTPSPPRAGEGGRTIVWIRNMDQWPEEARTALNELLEKGFIDLEAGEGRAVRFWKPEGLLFLAEGDPSDVSKPFLSRWAKVRLGADSPGETVRRLLSMGLGREEARLLSRLWARISDLASDAPLSPEDLDRAARAVLAARSEAPGAPALGRVGREAERILGARLSALDEGRDEALRALSLALSDFAGPSAEKERFALRTRDGTLSSAVVSVDGIPVRSRPGAPPVIEALRRHGVRTTREALRGLSLLARADSIGSAVSFIGEPGGLKSKLPELWACLTGRDFLKVQAHAGSSVNDLTVDVAESPSGDMALRRKEFYETLRRGNAVILIDEANAAPWVLWVLEPLLRGEREVSPMYPEEPPFRIGGNLTVAMAYNSDIRSGRYLVDPRVRDRVLLSRLELPRPEEVPDIVETFYGVWERLKTSARLRPPAGPSEGNAQGKTSSEGKESGSGKGKPEGMPKPRPKPEPKTGPKGDAEEERPEEPQEPRTKGGNPEGAPSPGSGAGGGEGGSQGEGKASSPQGKGKGGSPGAKTPQPQGSSSPRPKDPPPEADGPAFEAGARTEFIFHRLREAMRERASRRWRRVKEGTRVDPVALALNREKKFLARERSGALRKVAVSILMDFSLSMKGVRDDLAFAVHAVGGNLWRLRDQAPSHFAYDLSWFDGRPEASTVVPMGARLAASENERRIAEMSRKAGLMEGTNLLGAMRSKLKDIQSSPEARRAQVRYMILFTDGDKDGQGQAVARSGGGFVLTPAMRAVLGDYRRAGVEVVVVGMGEGALQVCAFKGPGLHFVRIPDRQPLVLAEAIARVAEQVSLRSAPLPEGDITAVIGLGNNR